MIELKFYRDDEYVYINNPDGTTKKVAIEDFENAVSGEGGGSGEHNIAISSVKWVNLRLLEDTTIQGFSSLWVENDTSAFKDSTDTVVDISTGIFCPYLTINDSNEGISLSLNSSLIHSIYGEYSFEIYNGSAESKLISNYTTIISGVFYQLVPTNETVIG